MKINDNKTINAWCSYDWANSAYNLIITSAIFPIYYANSTKASFGGDIVNFFSFQVNASVLYSYAISFSFLIVVILYPLLSGVADHRGTKKAFMRFFTYIGSGACIGLYLFDGSNVEFGISMAILASTGYATSLVFYNAFLPEIVTTEKMDKVSAKGFSMGYIGSVLLLIFSLYMILNPSTFGFADAGNATRFVFLIVGVWWLLFAHYSFAYLEDKKTNQSITWDTLKLGFEELKICFDEIKVQRTTPWYLASFFTYSMGVQTVMLLAPLYAADVVGMQDDEMILIILILQLVAIVGAYSVAWLSKITSNKTAILITVSIWMGVCMSAYVLVDKTLFYVLAGIIGFVMGGIQSISRSTFAKLIPESTDDTASYFSFYDTTEKLAIVIGTFSYGFILHVTGNMRNSMLIMTLFFALGIYLLSKTKFGSNKQG